MTAPQHDREGRPRKAYSKPRNRRRDMVLSQRAARARSWQEPLTHVERMRLSRKLDTWRAAFWFRGERQSAAEMQQLRRDLGIG